MASKTESTLASLNRVFKAVDLSPSCFLASAVLDLLAAVSEAAGMFLLIPLMRGAISGDFGSLADYGLVRRLMSVRPLAVTSNAPGLFLALSGLVLATSAMRIALTHLSTIRFMRIVRRFADALRRLLFERCMRFGKMFFDRARGGQVQHVLLGSTDAIVGHLLAGQDMLASLFLLSGYLLIMSLVSLKLTLGVAAFYPLLHWGLGALAGRTKEASLHQAEARRALAGHAGDIISNIVLIKASSAEDAEVRRFGVMSAETARRETELDVKAGLAHPVQEGILLLALVGVLLSVAFMAGDRSPRLASGLLVYVYLLRRASNCLASIGRFGARVASLEGPLSEVLGFLDDSDKALVPDGRVEFRGFKDTIEFRALRYCFPDGSKVLDGISLSFKRGQVTAVVGPSGAGKTTLVNLLMRFYDAPPASILLDGTDVREFTARSLRSAVAVVSQDTPLFHDTIRRNVAYPQADGVSEARLLDALRRSRLHDVVMALPQGLETVIGDQGVMLSGGERQRLSIARAMYRDAAILILDEATSSLDSQTEALIQESIDELVKNRTAIVIAHRLSTIRNADRIVVLEAGKVVEEGPRQELLDKNGAFRRYWDAQRFD